MFKRKSRVLYGVLAFLMAVGLFVSGGTSKVLAVDNLFGSSLQITKTIKKDLGTTTPGVGFVYEFEKFKFNESTDTENLPAIADATVSFTSSSTESTVNDVVTVTESTTITLPSVGTGGFSKAGEYVYNITETAPTMSGTDTFTTAPEAYRMHVYVINGTSGLELKGVAVYKTITENGNVVETDKIDGDESGSTIPFSGVYRKIAGSGVENATDPYASFTLSKTTTGDLADLTQKFEFTLNFKSSSLHTDSQTYNYKVLDKDDNPVSGKSGQFTLAGAGSEDHFEVNLKHGEKVVVENLPTGTTFHGLETGYGSYTPSVVVTSNGASAEKFDGSQGNDLVISTSNTAAYTTLLGEGVNSAAVTNDYSSTNITGILLDNLPFIILIVVGAAGFGYYAVNRKRNAVR